MKFKTLLYVYKALNDLSPVYLTDCIANDQGKACLTLEQPCLTIPKRKMRIADGSFIFVSGQLSGTYLPQTIKILTKGPLLNCSQV